MELTIKTKIILGHLLKKIEKIIAQYPFHFIFYDNRASRPKSIQ